MDCVCPAAAVDQVEFRVLWMGSVLLLSVATEWETIFEKVLAMSWDVAAITDQLKGVLPVRHTLAMRVAE